MKKLLLLFVLISCNQVSENETKDEVGEIVEVRPRVIMTIADDKAIARYVETEGIVESAKQLNIVSRESGYLVNHQLIDGKVVEQGELLFELDTRAINLRIREAEIALTRAERDVSIEMKIRESSNERLDKQMIKSLRMQYGVDEAQIRLNDLVLSKEFMRMNAPFSGILSVPTTRNEGDFLSGGTSVGMLIKPDQNRLKLFVLQHDADKVELNQLVLSDDLDTLGNISAIAPLVDEETQSVTIWVTLKPNKRLMHGERLKARIIIDEERATIRVPRSAVLERDNKWVVFKNKNAVAIWVYVTPVAVNQEWAVVDGKKLAPGDTIAYDLHFTLSHLQKITPIIQ